MDEFYGNMFGNQEEEDSLTEEEVKELEEHILLTEEAENLLKEKLLQFSETKDAARVVLKNIGIKKMTLKDNDARAWTTCYYRFLHTGMMTQGEFMLELFKHGLRSMLLANEAGAYHEMMAYAAAQSLPPEALQRLSVKKVREGLAHAKKMRDKIVEEQFHNKSGHDDVELDLQA